MATPNTRDEVALMARLGSVTRTPMPADLEEVLRSRRRENRALAESMLAQDDEALASVVKNVLPALRKEAEPFMGRRGAIAAEVNDRILTPKGGQVRQAALTEELRRVFEEKVFSGAEQTLRGRKQDYLTMLDVAPPTPQHRAAAVTLATELRLQTPAHGMARLGEVVRDAVKGNDVGQVRAVLPFVKSLVEQQGTDWYGNSEAQGFVGRMEDTLKHDWRAIVGERRLAITHHLESSLRELKADALRTVGEPRELAITASFVKDSAGNHLNDFVAGKLYQSRLAAELGGGADADAPDVIVFDA